MASLNPALRDFWTAPTAPDGLPVRNRVLYGGRDSTKSWDAAGFAIFLAQACKVRFLCARQFQNKIEESVYTLLKARIAHFNLGHVFTILNNKIICNTTGSEFVFYGLWRHIDEIKSLEGIDICWIEEAHNLTEEQWEILEPTVRKEGSQFWIIFNPKLATDFTYKRFVVNPPPGTIKRLITYQENHFLSDTSRRVIEAKKAESYEDYEHIYLGIPKQDDEASVIKRSWILASIDAHKVLGFEPVGKKRIGFDVADSGDDLCANVYAHGPVALWADEWKAGEDELLKSCIKTYHKAIELGAEIDYDCIGVGATAGAKFKELNEPRPQVKRVRYFKFNAGDAVVNPDKEYQPKVTNKDFFSNRKAQAWWSVADRFRETYVLVNAARKGEKIPPFDPADLISLSSEIDSKKLEKLVDELAAPKKDYDKAGRVTVESKKDLAKREVKSPNLADAFVMAYAPRAGVQFDYSKMI